MIRDGVVLKALPVVRRTSGVTLSNPASHHRRAFIVTKSYLQYVDMKCIGSGASVTVKKYDIALDEIHRALLSV